MKYIPIIALLVFGNLHIYARNIAQEEATIPFQLIKNKYVIIQAVMNDKDTLNFYFDTGATTSLIDKNAAKRLGITPNYEQEIAGAGGKIKYQIALNQQININQVHIDSVNFVLDDLTRLKDALGSSFDGIIGYSVIKKFITEIDYENHIIQLYQYGTKLNLSSYYPISFTFDNGITVPQFDAEIELANSNTYKGKVLFDSGAGLSLLVNTPFSQANKLESQADKVLTTTSNNLSNKSVSRDIKVKQLKLGKFVFQNVPVGLASDKSGVSSYKGYMGILGAEVINRFDVLLDYDKMKLYLKPNGLYSRPFDIPLSGFYLKKNDEGKIYISKISKESPAYKKGIREGDELLSINGNADGNLDEYEKQLKQEGENARLVVKNAEGEKKYKIRLRKLL